MPNFNDFFWRSFLFNLYDDDTEQPKSDNTRTIGNACHFCASRGVTSSLFLWKERDKFICWNCKDTHRVPCPYCGRNDRPWNCVVCG